MLKKLKNWLESLLLNVQQSDNDDYIQRIELLLNELEASNNVNIDMAEIVAKLNDEKKALQLLVPVPKPTITKPSWLKGYMSYKPRRRFVSKNLDITKLFTKPQYCFDKSTLLYELLKKNNLLNVEKTFDNMKKIMRLITGMITYEYDKTDNWRPITDILMFGKGDCDDSGGIAITSALGMAGWNEDEVFVAAGWFYKNNDLDKNNRGGHAWGVAKCDGKWYVLEGTNRTAIPRLWSTWKKKYECSWGVCNWRWQGMISNGRTYL